MISRIVAAPSDILEGLSPTPSARASLKRLGKWYKLFFQGRADLAGCIEVIDASIEDLEAAHALRRPSR